MEDAKIPTVAFGGKLPFSHIIHVWPVWLENLECEYVYSTHNIVMGA